METFSIDEEILAERKSTFVIRVSGKRPGKVFFPATSSSWTAVFPIRRESWPWW